MNDLFIAMRNVHGDDVGAPPIRSNFPVIDGRAVGVLHGRKESLWLKACRAAATGRR